MNRYCWTYLGVRWPAGVSGVTYSFDSTVTAADQAAITSAIGLWNASPVGVLITVPRPGTAGPADIIFHSFSDASAGNDAHTVPTAMTGLPEYLDQADIYMNDATLNSHDALYRQMVAAHEIGHALGLGHVSVATFNLPPVDPCNYRSLMDDGGMDPMYACANRSGSQTSCAPGQSPMSGHFGPWVDEWAGIAAIYGISATITAAPCRPSLGGTTTYSSVRLRTGPGTGYSIVTTLATGTTFEVYSIATDSAGRTWVQIRTGSGATGYIASSYASFKGSVVTTGVLNVRTSPSTSASILGTVASGAREDLAVACSGTNPCDTNMSAADSSDRTWFRIRYNTTVGWIASWYTKPWSI